MWSRVAIVAGLLAGVVAATLVVVAILTLAPEGVPSTTPPPTIAPVTPTDVAPESAAAPTESQPVGGEGTLFHIGEPAPALSVPQVGGGSIDLANLRGKPVWVTFMGTYCPPCYDEFPLMNRFAALHEDDDLIVLAIDVGEEEGDVAAFARQLGAIFPMGLDQDGSVAKRWNAVGLPVHFWIDRDGIIRDGALGGIGPDLMARGLRTILPGVTVES
jgi:cytochrome c biogenesis protein CcmG/thiol:disulfide interchange protein DsbE